MVPVSGILDAMTSIFISYRRDDTAPHAGRLHDRLKQRFGDERVFMDIDDIEPGAPFPEALRRSVAKADVVLVMIGPNWLAADAAGHRRIDDEQDFVRFEIAAGLQRKARVIPVLVGGATMPTAAQLPDNLQPLADCQAVELTDRNYDRDSARLIDALGGKSSKRWIALAAAGLFALLASWQVLRPKSPPASFPPTAPAPAPRAEIGGDWQGDVYYEWDKRTVREPFSFRFVAGQLTGSAGFLGYPRGIVSGSLEGNVLAFETRSQGSINDKEVEYVHRYRGEVFGESIRLSMQTSGPYQSGVPREFVLTRKAR